MPSLGVPLYESWTTTGRVVADPQYQQRQRILVGSS